MIDDNKETVTVGLEKVLLQSERKERRKKIVKVVFIIFLCIFLGVAGFIGGCIFTSSLHQGMNADEKDVFGEIEAILQNYWVYAKDEKDLKTTLEDKAFYGMTTFEDDPYTTYMSPEELSEFTDSINMNYVGVGVQYSMVGDTALIQKVFKDSPAEKAGLLAGDILSKIDGVSIKGLSADEIKEKVLGDENSKVVITVIRDGKQVDVTVTRGYVDSSVFCYAADDYVVLELSSFGSDTASECIKYLNDYKDYKKIIIDLRDDTGGYQTAVKEIAGLFIGNKKVYLKQKDAKGNMSADLTSCSTTYDNFEKIVLLVNENTASAAEVFTICLKEQLDNVTIVGTRTYGKGVIQSTNYLINGGVLKFTSFYWYSPNGVSIHKIGIKPDVEVKLDDIAYDYYVEMDGFTTYEYDSVSEQVEECEKALDFLGYDVDRTDGYFDQKLTDVLKKYQSDNGLRSNGILDIDTYNSIFSDVVLQMTNKEKDKQFIKAVELLYK